MIIKEENNVDLTQAELTEKIRQNVNKEWKDEFKRGLGDDFQRQVQAQKVANFNDNQRVQGLSRGKTMRQVAEVPFYIWQAMKDIFGEDYWRTESGKNTKKHKEFHVVDRI